MADLRDFTGKNRKFTGTIGEKISSGTTAQRDASFGAGTLRFNSSTGLMEYYTGTEFKAIDAPPAITNFSVDGGSPVTSTFLESSSSVITIAINGTLFDTTGATVLFVGTGGGDVSPLTTVRNNSSLLTVTVNRSSFNNTYEPYDIRVTNGSGLSALLENCIVSDTAPSFATASGTLGTISNGNRSSYTLSPVTATDIDGDTITYSITSGSLPTGLSLNSSTGAISGTASAVGSNTVSTFTVSASTATLTSTRSFSITVNAPVVQTYTSGSGSFAVPVGVASVEVLVIAGGGSGGYGNGNEGGGGGGAGGLVYSSAFSVTPGGTVSYAVGGGGSNTSSPGAPVTNGVDTTFGSITAVGGGYGGFGGAGNPGGSGGGGSGFGQDQPAGSGTQAPSGGAPGFGNPGGSGRWTSGVNGAGGGGGGSGGAGTAGPGPSPSGAPGGEGRSYDITGSPATYAAGGRGGDGRNTGGPSAGGSANTGNGGNGANPSNPSSGSGGSGFIAIRY